MSKSTARPGRLVLVVGPSGVGKDTLIDGARAVLAGDRSVVFARREITRPAGAGGEDHAEVDAATLQLRRRTGSYLLSWEAHGLAYGVPAALADDLAAGRTVVANVSRAVLDEARARFANLRIISVTADPQAVAGRLAARGREDAAEIATRLARADELSVEGYQVVVVRNDGSAEEGVAAFTRAILD